jgi:hypothetical protein
MNLSHGLQFIGCFAIFGSFYAGIAQLVERHLAKVNVAGSNPVSRSTSAMRFWPLKL